MGWHLCADRGNGVGVYIYIAQNDEYYGSQQAQETYDALYAAHQEAGLDEAQIDALLQIQTRTTRIFAEHDAGGSLSRSCQHRI